MIDIENDYVQKDGLREDTVDKMIINIGEDDSDDETDDDDDDLIDENDRRLIDDSLKQFDASTSTVPQTETCTNVRRDLLPTLQNYDSNILDMGLPKQNMTHKLMGKDTKDPLFLLWPCNSVDRPLQYEPNVTGSIQSPLFLLWPCNSVDRPLR